MKKIYICHQYTDKTHFEALYRCANEYGYEIAEYFSLTEPIIRNCGKKLIREKKPVDAVILLFKWIANRMHFLKLRNEILIVGLAPYDNLMNRYKSIFSRNKSFYFTSYVFWGNDKVTPPRGSMDNKENFLTAVSECFGGVACVSEETEKGVSKYNSNTVVVNHSLDVSQYKKKDSYQRKNKIIFMGSFIDRKNVPLILKWLETHPDRSISVDFAGGGEYVDAVKDIEKRFKNAHYIGKLTKDEIKQRLCEYDFLILPSQQEPFGIVLLEALAAGVPCLVSNARGPQEIITDNYNGLMFDVNEDKERNFSAMMDRTLGLSDEEYKALSKNALESSYRYDIHEIVKKWIGLIESVN